MKKDCSDGCLKGGLRDGVGAGMVVCRKSWYCLLGGAYDAWASACERTLSNAKDESVVGESTVAPDANETKEFVVHGG